MYVAIKNIPWKLVNVNTCVAVTVHFTLQLGPICHLPIPDKILNSKVILEISSPMWKLLHWYLQYRSLYFTPCTFEHVFCTQTFYNVTVFWVLSYWLIVCLKNHLIFQIFCGRYQHLVEKYCHLRTYDKRWYW